MRIAMGAVKTLLKDFDNDVQTVVNEKVTKASETGYRSLGLTCKVMSTSTNAEEQAWRFVGIINLADPPRPDSAKTIDRLHELGIRVIMLTGDSLPIGRHVAQLVGIGNDIRSLAEWRKVDGNRPIPDLDKLSGLAEVFPEVSPALFILIISKILFLLVTNH